MKTKDYLPLISLIGLLVGVALLPSLPAAGAETTETQFEYYYRVEAYVADTDPKGVYIRSGPGSDYPVIAKVHHGELISITGSAGEWMRTSNISPTGWIYGPLLGVNTRTDPYDSWGWQDPSRLVPIFGGSPFDSGIVAWAPEHTALRVIGCAGGSIKVRYKGVEGWLRLDDYSAEVPSIPSEGGEETGMEVVPCENVEAYVIDKDPKGVNIRFGPGTGYPSIVTLPTDRPVKVHITGALGDWVLIKNPVFVSKEKEMTMEITAWVNVRLLGVKTKYAGDPSGFVILYQEPNADSPVATEVPRDTEATILGCRGGWVKVRYDKQEGWLAPDAQCGDPFNECY